MQEVLAQLSTALALLEKAQRGLSSTEDALTEYMAGEAIVHAQISTAEAILKLEGVKQEDSDHDAKRGCHIRQDATKRNSTR